MILSWLKQRIDKLYAVDGEDVGADVLKVAKQIYAKATEIYAAPVAGAALGAVHAAMANATSDALKQFTGFSSVAGRIARMEMAHLVEALRLLVALEAPNLFEQVAGPSLVPVTTPKVETNMARATGNNADEMTSTSTLQNAVGVDYAKLGETAPALPNHFDKLAEDWEAAKVGSSIGQKPAQ